jgi:carboxypeptidase Q
MMTNIMKVRRKSFFLLTILFNLTFAQQDTFQLESTRIAGSILVGGHSFEYLQELTDGFGGRISGSTAYQRASEWAAQQFREAGIKDVKFEPFTLPNGWERISARAHMITPLDRQLQVHSYGWSPSTPKEGVQAEVVYIRRILSQEGIKSQADKIKDRIVLVNGESFYQDERFLDSKYIDSKNLLKELGARAILVRGSTENNVTSSWNDTWGGKLEPLPVLEIGMEDGKLIERLLMRGPVTIELQNENKITESVKVNNVVAEIRGREKPDEWILIGAHLDSWDQGTGAQDGGSGCAMVLEAARVLAQSNVSPRRSIRFVLWGGEEQGLMGSNAYIQTHTSEMKKCIVALNTGLCAGVPHGWILRGNNDMKKALRPLSQSLSGLGGDGLKSEVKFEELSDWESFFLEGIPTLDLWVDLTSYWEVHNKSGDTFDKVDAHNIATGSAIVAITAAWFAEQTIVPSHLDQATIEKILIKAEVSERINDLRALGVLKSYTK